MKRVLITMLVAANITACSATYYPEFTKTGTSQAEPLPLDCPITIFTATPKEEFVELGIVDIEFHCLAAHCNKEMKTAAGVKEIVREKVCGAGGNGIFLWEATGYGEYRKATVVRYKPNGI